MNIAVYPKDILRLIHGHEGSTQLLQVAFGGLTDAKMAIIRDMQFDPVSEDLIHVDLQEVAMDRAIQVTVAVHHVGEPIGVKDTQGILEMILREVQVSCLPGNIPDVLEPTSRAGHPRRAHRQGPDGARGRAHPERPRTRPSSRWRRRWPRRPRCRPRRPTDAATAAEPEVLTERKPKEEAAEARRTRTTKKK